MTAGIYCITNQVNGFQYVGSALDTDRRWRRHKNDLVLGIHHNLHLQRAFSRYGLVAFRWEILETCEPTRVVLLQREQHYLDTLRPIYNQCRVAGSMAGLKMSPERYERHCAIVRTSEHRALVARITKSRWADPEHRAKVMASMQRVMGSEEYRAIKSLEIRARWADPVAGPKMRAVIVAIHSSPEMRHKKLKATRARWAAPGAREHAGKVSRERQSFPEVKAEIGARTRALWQDPTYREKTRAGMKATQSRPDVLAAKAAEDRRRWSDPEYRARVSASQRIAWEKRRQRGAQANG